MHTNLTPSVSGLITGLMKVRGSSSFVALLGLNITGSQTQKPTFPTGSLTDVVQLIEEDHTEKNIVIYMLVVAQQKKMTSFNFQSNINRYAW